MEAALKANFHVLQYASDAFRGYKEFVLAALEKNVYALQYALPALLEDKEFVLAAIKEHSYALLYAPQALRGDKEFVLAAVLKDINVLEYASNSLREDENFVKEATRAAASKKLTDLIDKKLADQEEAACSPGESAAEAAFNPDDSADMTGDFSREVLHFSCSVC